MLLLQLLPTLGDELPNMEHELPTLGDELPNMEHELPNAWGELPMTKHDLPTFGRPADRRRWWCYHQLASYNRQRSLLKCGVQVVSHV